jgi:hypothetical protein
LLVVLKAVESLDFISVLFREDFLEVSHVRRAVTRLGRGVLMMPT